MKLLENLAVIIEHPSAKKHPMANVFNMSLAIVLNRAKEYTPNDDIKVITAMSVINSYLKIHENEVETDVANKKTVDSEISQDE